MRSDGKIFADGDADSDIGTGVEELNLLRLQQGVLRVGQLPRYVVETISAC